MITSTSRTTPDHAHFDAYKAPVGFLPGSAPGHDIGLLSPAHDYNVANTTTEFYNSSFVYFVPLPEGHDVTQAIQNIGHDVT